MGGIGCTRIGKYKRVYLTTCVVFSFLHIQIMGSPWLPTIILNKEISASCWSLYVCALNKNNKDNNNKIILLEVGLNPKLKLGFENKKKRNDIKNKNYIYIYLKISPKLVLMISQYNLRINWAQDLNLNSIFANKKETK